VSRVGRKPVKIPQGVAVEIKGSQLIVNGPKGGLVQKIRPELKIEKKADELRVLRRKKTKLSDVLSGVTRSLIANMIKGVVDGFEKKLELKGVGYRAALEGEKLKLNVGFSHPVIIEPIEGIKYQLEGNNLIKISGIDKQQVGQTAAMIRAIKRPDPYKGKGIRYRGEVVKLKPGKAAKVGAEEA